RGVDFEPQLYNLRFAQRNQRRNYFDLAFAGTRAYYIVESTVICGTAIRVPGTILLYSSNVNPCRSQYFSPTHGSGKKVRVTKRHVSYRNFAGADFCLGLNFGYGNGIVRQSRAANPAKDLIAQGQRAANAQALANRLKRPALAGLSPLAIAQV